VLNFPTGSKIEGCPISHLRKILGSMAANRDRWAPSKLRGKTTPRIDNAIAAEIAMAMKLFDETDRTPTPLGISILGSQSRSRITRDSATAILHDFLQKVVAYNANPERIDNIRQVWVYGSYVKGAAMVGDVDIEFTTSRLKNFGSEAYDQHVERLFDIYCSNTHGLMIYQKSSRVRARMLLGGNKHARLSIHHGDNMLRNSAEPCALYFADITGIISVPKLLEKHPKATTRSSDMIDRSEIPSEREILASKLPLKPMHAHWTTKGKLEWRGQSARAFADTANALQINRICWDRNEQTGTHHRIYTNTLTPSELAEHPLPPDLASLVTESCDGVTRCLIWTTSATIILSRNISENADGTITYSSSITSTSPKGPRRFHQTDSFLAGVMIATIMAGDLMMIERRRPQTGEPTDIDLEITPVLGELGTIIESYIALVMDLESVS